MVCALSLYLLKRRGRRPRSVKAAMFGVCGFYLLTAVAGAAAGPEYSVAALLAGVIPLSALALLTAKILDKTAVADGHLHDASTDDGRDTTPGIGLDDETPLGDTPEHSDAQNPV
jgi:heme A synthase